VEAHGGIGDTMVVGQIVCFGSNPFIVVETYVPAAGHIVAYMILPIGGINIFAGFTSVQAALEAIRPTQPALDTETALEIGSGSTLSADAAEFQTRSNPNQTLSTLEEEIMVESRSTSVLPIEGPGYDQYHFVGHINSVPASPKDGNDDESMLHAINEECVDSYSDVSTGTTPVRREKID
jgi:hypothetical protein